MKNVFLFLVISLLGQTVHAHEEDVRDVVLDIRESISAGKYAALPSDAQEQVLRTLQAVRDQLSNGNSSRAVFACILNRTGYYAVTDLTNGQQIGGSLSSLDACKRTLPKPGQVFSCLMNDNGYYGIFNLQSLKQISGDYNSLDSCLNSLPR